MKRGARRVPKPLKPEDQAHPYDAEDYPDTDSTDSGLEEDEERTQGVAT